MSAQISAFGPASPTASFASSNGRVPRRATPAEREAVFSLRYEAYVRNGLIDPRPDGRLYDPRYDDCPDTWITATYIDGELASSTRVSVARDENAVFPAYTRLSRYHCSAVERAEGRGGVDANVGADRFGRALPGTALRNAAARLSRGRAL